MSNPDLSVLQYYEIAEADHTLLNPMSIEKLLALGASLKFNVDTHILDLACGKAEMLVQWAEAYAISGVGIDISEVFLAAGRQRISSAGLSDRITLIRADAGAYEADPAYNVVSCLGATWIGDGLEGTLDLMRRALDPGQRGLLLVGEPYWHAEPSEQNRADLPGDWAVTLGGLAARIEATGVEIVEMVVTAKDDWDRYEARHWIAVDRWADAHPEHPLREAVLEMHHKEQAAYFRTVRDRVGWAVFALRVG